MSERKTRPVWPILAAVMIGLALYILSVGPACRQFRVGPGEIRASQWLVRPYFPVFWLMENGPAPVRHAIRAYVGWWIA